MTPYKGIIRIICGVKGSCPRKLQENVDPSCMNCTAGITQALDLEGNMLFEHRVKLIEEKKQAKKKKRQ